VWRWDGADYDLVLGEPATPATAEAVAFVRRGGKFAILDRAGMLRVATGEPEPAGAFTAERYPVDLLAVDGGYLVLDCFGGLTGKPDSLIGEEALPQVNWGFPIARRLQTLAGEVFVLDGLGGIHAPGEEKGPRTNGAVYYSQDLVRDFEPVGNGFYLMDFAGRISRTDGADPVLDPSIIPADLRALSEAARTYLESGSPPGREQARVDRAVDLVYDLRTRTFYVLFQNGRVTVIRTD